MLKSLILANIVSMIQPLKNPILYAGLSVGFKTVSRFFFFDGLETVGVIFSNAASLSGNRLSTLIYEPLSASLFVDRILNHAP